MIKKVMLIGSAVLAVSLFGATMPASAHFMVKDSDTGVKALFHVTPDHDPIAGEESVISYDFGEAGLTTEPFSFLLTVKPTKGEEVRVPVDISGDVVLASYTFPSQGFYDISLRAKDTESGNVSQLEYGQRVSRGVVVEEDESLGTLEMLAVGAVVLIAVSAIIFSLVNDRKNRKGDKNEKANRR